MLEKWPNVIDEWGTVAKLHDGFSIGRWGDGEAKIMSGQGYVREPPNPVMAEELRAILAAPDPRFLPGIPTMNKDGVKYPNWKQRQARFLPFLSPYVQYYSAFITRPDSAQWIITEAYAESVENFWRGKKVALICEPNNKLLVVVASAARKVWHISCPMYGASAHIDAWERDIVRGRPDIAILSHGVSATVLAHRLACHDIQAVDLGSIGGFLARMLYLEKLPHMFATVLHHPECPNHSTLRTTLEGLGFRVLYCGEQGTD